MKVALISLHSFLRPGGVKRHIFGLYNEFKKMGISSKIIAPRRKRSENYGKDVILLGTSFPFPLTGGFSDFVINFNHFAIKRILKKEKFDVLHFHNFGFPSSFQILLESEALNILTFHSNIEISDFFKKFNIFLEIFSKIAQWKIDGIIGVAPLTLKVFKDYKKPKIVIPNGVNLEEFNPRVNKIKKFLDGKINLLFLGRIEKRKGLIYLLKAYEILVKKFSNLRLIIVGEGELKKECQDFVFKRKLPEVYFEGEKSEREVPPYYNTCDIYISPAIFGESFGLVLLEAMACQKPVVAFANEGYKELLGGTKLGEFLVKPKDFYGLAKKIEILIRNKKLRDEIGKWAFQKAQEYSWASVAKKVLDFYQYCQQIKNGKK